MSKVSIVHYYGDYVDNKMRRDRHNPDFGPGPFPLTSYSSEEIKCKNPQSAKRVLTRELNRDKQSPAYSYDRRITHQRPNQNDILHVTVSRWEGATHSTLYVVEMNP